MDGNDYGNACLAECYGGGIAFDGSCYAGLDCGACADDNRDCVAEDYEGTCDEGYEVRDGCYCSEDCDAAEAGQFGCFLTNAAGASACGPAFLLSVIAALQ